MGDKGASSSATAQAEQPKPQSIAHYINKIKQGDNATWEKVRIIHGPVGCVLGEREGVAHSTATTALEDSLDLWLRIQSDNIAVTVSVGQAASDSQLSYTVCNLNHLQLRLGGFWLPPKIAQPVQCHGYWCCIRLKSGLVAAYDAA